MINYVATAANILFSPAVWMTIVGMLLMKTNIQQLSNVSLQYTDGMSGIHEKPLRKHFLLNTLAALSSIVVSLLLNISLSLETLILFWIFMIIMQTAKAMPASAFLSVLAVYIISRFIDIGFVSSNAINIAILSQGLMAVLLLTDISEPYPLIAKLKDGSIKGVHNHYKVWFMPVFEYNLSLSSISNQMLFMFFYFLNEKFTKETYKSYKKRNCIFMMSLSAAAAVASMVYKNHTLIIIVCGTLAIIWTIIERIRNIRSEDLFTHADDGIRVLYVYPGGSGDKAGILPGDIIISLNNNRVMNIGGIENFFSAAPPHIFIQITRRKEEMTLEFKDYQNGIDGLDCSYIPRKPVKYQLNKD